MTTFPRLLPALSTSVSLRFVPGASAADFTFVFPSAAAAR